MATTDIALIANNETFLRRFDIALVKKAIEVLASGTATANQTSWCHAVIQSRANYEAALRAALITLNPASGDSSLITDTDLSNALTGALDALVAAHIAYPPA